MPVTLLLGRPRSGKTYEATKYYVQEALKQERRVITNIPLNLDEFTRRDPAYADLIDIRPRVNDDGSFHFSRALDYATEWRNAEKNWGPVYVIDECQLALPSKGTHLEVLHWFQLHGHSNSDVVLMTQEHRQMDQVICRLAEVVIRVRKNAMHGSENSYTRQVFADARTRKAMDTSVRKYDADVFPLYQSFTLGGAGDQRKTILDGKPIWLRWPFVLAAILLLGGGANLFWEFYKEPSLAGGAVKPLSSTPVRAPGEIEANRVPERVRGAGPANVLHVPGSLAWSTDPRPATGLWIVGRLEGEGGVRWVIQRGRHVIMSDRIKEWGYDMIMVDGDVCHLSLSGRAGQAKAKCYDQDP